MKLVKTLLAVALGAAINAAPASAEILNGWNLNLSLVGVGGTDATNIDRIDLQGQATVIQNVVNNNALGEDFSESGYLQMTGYHKEGDALATLFDLPDGYTNMYILFTGLTGTLNGDGSITFDAGVGTVGLWLGDDGTPDGDASDLQLVDYSVINPSGGSDLNFFGGGGANATVDVTLDALSEIVAGLFTDAGNNPLAPGFALHLVNVDSLLNEDFNPNPDNSGIDANGDGVSIIHVENGGQYKVSAVPEPATLALLGVGLLGVGALTRRKNSRKS